MTFDIENITIKQARELASMFAATAAEKTAEPHPSLGKYVIIRSYEAGVFAGVLRTMRGPHDDEAILDDCRRLWGWKGNSVALSGVAQGGLIASGSKVDAETQGHGVKNVIEVIPCTSVAEKSIRGF